MVRHANSGQVHPDSTLKGTFSIITESRSGPSGATESAAFGALGAVFGRAFPFRYLCNPDPKLDFSRPDFRQGSAFGWIKNKRPST